MSNCNPNYYIKRAAKVDQFFQEHPEEYEKAKAQAVGRRPRSQGRWTVKVCRVRFVTGHLGSN